MSLNSVLAFALLVAFSLLSISYGQSSCANEGGVPFTISLSKTNITVQHGTIPRGMIRTCMYAPATNTAPVTVSYKTSSSQMVRGHEAVLPIINDNESALPECSPNRFPKSPFVMKPGSTCYELPPWCSTELWINFSFVFSARDMPIPQ